MIQFHIVAKRLCEIRGKRGDTGTERRCGRNPAKPARNSIPDVSLALSGLSAASPTPGPASGPIFLILKNVGFESILKLKNVQSELFLKLKIVQSRYNLKLINVKRPR